VDRARIPECQIASLSPYCLIVFVFVNEHDYQAADHHHNRAVQDMGVGAQRESV
jgi:hypothetical protein